MPELDNSPSQGIDLEDPAPRGLSAISGRLRYTAWAIAIGLCLAVVGGMSLRLINKGATDKEKQNSHFASEPASSDRESVEKRQSTGESAKPLSTVEAQNKQPGQVPAPAVPGAAITHPELVHEPESTAHSPQQTPQITAEEQAKVDAQRQAYQEEIAARKAPTSYQAYVALASSSGSPEVAQSSPLAGPALPAFPSMPGADQLTGEHQDGGADLASLGKKLGLTRTSGTAGSYNAQNSQENKSQFLDVSSDTLNPADDYLKATRVDPLSAFEIQQGSVIPAVMPLGINSDTPGQVTAEIRVDVNDSLCGVMRKDGATHCYVLIPHGSKLVGEYNSNVTYGQNRVQVAWTRVIFPDSTSLDLGRMNGLAADGSAGLKGKVDDHWRSKIAGIALTSFLSAGLAVSQNRSNNSVLQYPSTGEVIGASIGQSASQLGQELTQRNFNRQPTLVIRPGQKFLVYVRKDIVFPSPYEPRF